MLNTLLVPIWWLADIRFNLIFDDVSVFYGSGTAVGIGARGLKNHE